MSGISQGYGPGLTLISYEQAKGALPHTRENPTYRKQKCFYSAGGFSYEPMLRRKTQQANYLYEHVP